MSANKKNTKTTQIQGRMKQSPKSEPCPWLCNLLPTDVPGPGAAQSILHPRKDVFVLKVAKIGPNGDRRCKIELELVTPKGPEKKAPGRVDTREAQCDPEPAPCCCMTTKKQKKRKEII